MAGLRDQQKQKRREAILVVSARLFGQQGYAATSMEEIAAAAELSVGTLYNYFKSKGDITLALYRAGQPAEAIATLHDLADAKPGQQPLPLDRAVTAMAACMWSGVPIVTASLLSPSLAIISR